MKSVSKKAGAVHYRRFDRLEERSESTHRLLLYAVVGIATLTLAGYSALATLIAFLA